MQISYLRIRPLLNNNNNIIRMQMKEKFPRSSPLITQLMIRYIYKVRYAECYMNSIEEEEECNGIIMNVHINYIIMRSRSSSSRRMR